MMENPSRARYQVIGFAVGLAIITYMQRVIVAQAAPTLQQDLGLTKVQMGWVFGAFLWTYALFEIPGGWAADRWGARKVLAGIVTAWSLFTAATGWVWSLGSLLAARGLFGAAQAGCFPSLTRALRSWLPARERALAQGVIWLSARWGGAFTPLLVAWILEHLSWRRAFEMFGLLGLIWAAAFFAWFRDDPRRHRRVNPAEAALLPSAEPSHSAHAAVPWRKFLTSKTVLLLWGQYMCLNFGWQFFVTWLPTYLQEARGVSLQKGAFLAGIPLFFGGIGSICCGSLVSWLEKRAGNTKLVRRSLACTGFGGAALCFVISVRLQDPVWAMVALGLASFFNDLVMPPAWATCMDIGGRHCGTLSGSMNMMGGAAAALSPIAVSYILVWSGGNWVLTFYLAAVIYILGGLIWLVLDPVTPLSSTDQRSDSK